MSARSRIADRLLELRYRWTFQWAHHPLCTRFEHDVLRWGLLHLCRSCTALGFGLAAAALVWTLAPIPSYAMHVGLVLGAAAILVPLGRPRIHARLARPVRDASRGATGALIVSVLAFVPTGRPLAAVALGLPLAGAAWWLARRRNDARASRCDGCDELGRGVCSGYARQAERLRAWEEQAAARLAGRMVRSGSIPGSRGARTFERVRS